MKKEIRIGLIGYGFMGRTHSNAYSQLSHFFDTQHVPVRQAVCGRDEAKVKAFAEKWGYASYETDWRELVKREDIDVRIDGNLVTLAINASFFSKLPYNPEKDFERVGLISGNAYVLAARMGYDGAYVAALVTLSTLLGMLSLPFALGILRGL